MTGWTASLNHFANKKASAIDGLIPKKECSSTTTLPESARSRPPMIFSMVVFPEPEGPAKATNPPLSTDRLAPLIAIDFQIMILGCVIGRRRITIQHPPSGLVKFNM